MQNRRKFIRDSLLAASAIGFFNRAHLPSPAIAGDEDSKPIRRTLGRTGIRLPVVSMGTASTTSPALIRSALDNGIRLLATSQAYHEGNNERMIGTVIKEFERDSIIILTNSFDIKWIDTQTGILNSSFSSDRLLRNAEESLSRLNVEKVDIFTQPFAAGTNSVSDDRVLKALEKLKKEGLTRYTGIATHRNEPEAIRAAADTGVYDIIMTSYNFMKTNIEELDDAIGYAADKGLGIIAMKTLAGAFRDKERSRPINTGAALKWVLQNENIHTTVPDSSSFEQLSQKLEIMSDISLSPEEREDLIAPQKEALSGLFCQQCGRCLPQCPRNIDIPTLMRSYMYAFGYQNTGMACNAFHETGLDNDPCLDCETCSVKCTAGFNIREKIKDLLSVTDKYPFSSKV